MHPSAPAVAARPPLSSTTALTASAWTRSIRGNRLFRPIKMSDNALVAPSEPALTHARPVAVETLGLEIVEVILKSPLGVLSEIAQKRPGIDAGGVHVVEAEPHRVIADRIDGENGDVALAADRLALCFGVTLHFGGRAGHPQQLRGKAESLAIVKCDMEGAAVLG